MLDLMYEFWRDVVFTWTDIELNQYTDAIHGITFLLTMVSVVAITILLFGVAKWALSFVFGFFGRNWL